MLLIFYAIYKHTHTHTHVIFLALHSRRDEGRRHSCCHTTVLITSSTLVPGDVNVGRLYPSLTWPPAAGVRPVSGPHPPSGHLEGRRETDCGVSVSVAPRSGLLFRAKVDKASSHVRNPKLCRARQRKRTAGLYTAFIKGI